MEVLFNVDDKNKFYLWDIDVADKLFEATKARKKQQAVPLGEGYSGLKPGVMMKINNLEVEMIYPYTCYDNREVKEENLGDGNVLAATMERSRK